MKPKRADSSIELKDYSITHAHQSPVFHPRLKTEITDRSVVRYMRFLRRVRIDRLEWPFAGYGRWVPSVPLHPAHLQVSVLDCNTCKWNVVEDVNLPPDDRIAGKGLRQGMSEQEMNAFFRQLYNEPSRMIDLGGIEADHLRLECDREHPVWPSHGETNGCPWQVPYGMLHKVRAFGSSRAELPVAEYLPCLKMGVFRPRAPRGMVAGRRGETVTFEGKNLSVGFGLRRPTIMHMGWDVLGGGRAGANRLSTRRPLAVDANHGMSGPLLVTLDGNYGSHFWTGRIDVEGNRVAYRNLRCAGGMKIDAQFEVEPDGIRLHVRQRSDCRLPVLEAATWRWVWDLSRGMTSVVGVSSAHPGRCGQLIPPVLFASDGVGCLSCNVIEGDVSMLSDAYRPTHEVAGELLIGNPQDVSGCRILPKGPVEATVELKVAHLAPPVARGKKPSEGVRRFWGGAFSCYRSEFAGFSNHAASTNCHVNQTSPIDVAAFTVRPKNGPDPLEMASFTVTRALLDGGGYGYFRNLYLDSDPVLVCAAGRIWQVRQDEAWLAKIKPGLVEAAQRILRTFGRQGLAIARDLTGNRWSYRWSSNAWDVVGFGHMDAYVNAWTYRAMRNAAVLLRRTGEHSLAARCAEAAVGMREPFTKHLVNPQTGWVASWKSRDGRLHDYAHLFVNGPACAFGVLEPKLARRALANLERLRARLGQSARVGLPTSLLPLHVGDHMLPILPSEMGGRAEPTFESYTDGCCAPFVAGFYIRALGIHGLKKAEQTIARELDESFVQGLFTGGAGTTMRRGNEFLSWEGLTTGYEGSFVINFGTYYAVAIAQGLFTPPDPEWWPAEG